MVRNPDYSSVLLQPDWQGTAEEQKRVAADGRAYTAKEFSDYYGSKASELWNDAEIAKSLNSRQSQSVTSTTSPDAATKHWQETVEEQKRVAWDGRAYTAKQFCDHYGSRASEFWNVAEILLEQSTNATTSQQSQSVISMAAGLDHPQGETTSPDAATEHNLGPRVLLSVADIQWHKKEEATFRPPRSIHKIARNALQKITLVHVDGDMARDLNDWFDWRRYIACHKDAKRIIGAGVTRAVAESIPESRDTNQGGQERVDFVFTRADGTLCFVHPGVRASQDAFLKFS